MGGAKILQKIMPAPSVIKIVKYCGVRGRGGIGGRQNPTKIIASLISVIKIVQYFRILGGGALVGAKILQNEMIMAPPLSVIKIVKYCGQKYNAYKQYNCILPVTN